jgi:hypothetical protein
MSVADRIPGMAPRREVAPQDDGTFIVYVTPGELSGFPPKRVSVHLTAEQYDRYCQWRLGRGLVQDMLGDLPGDDCEKLISGLTDEDLRSLSDFDGDDHD